MQVLMNRSHLIGLLLARGHAAFEDDDEASEKSIEGILGGRGGRLGLLRKSIETQSLRELRDTVQNIQLHWAQERAVELLPWIRRAVDACFDRFGVLASIEADPRVMDDASGIEVICSFVIT